MSQALSVCRHIYRRLIHRGECPQLCLFWLGAFLDVLSIVSVIRFVAPRQIRKPLSCLSTILGYPCLPGATVWLLALGWFDYHYRRLPNSLTMGGAAVLMACSLVSGGWQGFF